MNLLTYLAGLETVLWSTTALYLVRRQSWRIRSVRLYVEAALAVSAWASLAFVPINATRPGFDLDEVVAGSLALGLAGSVARNVAEIRSLHGRGAPQNVRRQRTPAAL